MNKKQNIDTKTKIINAAKNLFSNNGFHGASIRDIAIAAGVNKSLLHYHFKNKEEILNEVAGKFLDDSINVINELLSSENFKSQTDMPVLQEIMNYLFSEKDFLNIIIQTALNDNEKHHFIFQLVEGVQNKMESFFNDSDKSIQQKNDLDFNRFYFILIPLIIYIVFRNKYGEHFKINTNDMDTTFKNGFKNILMSMEV